MSIFPYQTFTFHTYLKPSRIIAKVKGIVFEKNYLWGTNKSGKPFIGRVNENCFTLSLGRESVMDRMAPPLVIGEIMEEEKGASVKLVIRFRLIEFLCLLFVIYGIGMFVYLIIRKEFPAGFIFAPVMFLLFYVFWMAYFNKWAKKSKEIILKTII